MTTPHRIRILAAVAITLAVVGGSTVAAMAMSGNGDDPLPVEPDGGIGDTPAPAGPDGDSFDSDDARQAAHGVLGMYENDLPGDVRVSRRGTETLVLTEDYVLGRLTVELDAEDGRYRVTSVTVELPGGPESFQLTPS